MSVDPLCHASGNGNVFNCLGEEGINILVYARNIMMQGWGKNLPGESKGGGIPLTGGGNAHKHFPPKNRAIFGQGSNSLISFSCRV